MSFVILKFGRLMRKASTSEVVIFDTSAGWNRTGPNSNQDREPLTSTPRKMTATSKNRTPMYKGIEAPSQMRGGRTKTIRPASPKAVRIQTNCLPLREVQDRMLSGSEEWMEA